MVHNKEYYTMFKMTKKDACDTTETLIYVDDKFKKCSSVCECEVSTAKPMVETKVVVKTSEPEYVVTSCDKT